MDCALLDRFQTTAHYIHDKCGIKPIALAQAIGVGAVVTMMTRHWLLYGSMVFSMDLFWELVYPGFFLALTFFPNRQERGRNPRRHTLMPMRVGFFLIMSYMWFVLFTDGTIIHQWINYLLAFAGIRMSANPFWPLLVYSTATTLNWIELCLICIDNPPPRKFRSLVGVRFSGH